MNHTFPSMVLAFCSALAMSVQAGSFFSDFNSTNAPPRTRVSGDAVIETEGGVRNTGYLRLTPAEPKRQGSFVVDDLDDGEPVTSFIMAAMVRIGGGRGAEGFSFSYNSDLPPGIGVNGAGRGLDVIFRTYVYASGQMQPPEARIQYNGHRIEKKSIPQMRTGESFVPVVIKLDTNGVVSVFYNDTLEIKDLKVDGYKTLGGGQFGFGATCVVATDNHCLDDLSILTGTAPKPLPEFDVATLARLLANRGGNKGVERMTFMSGNEILKGILYHPNTQGPFPTILFSRRSDAPRAVPTPFPSDVDTSFAPLGGWFMENNCALFIPEITKPSDQASPDSTNTVKTPSQFVEENERQARVLQDALTWLNAQSFVDEKRVALMGDGNGANPAILAAAAETNLTAVVLFSPDAKNWLDNAPWRDRLKKDLGQIKAPAFLAQPSNVRGMVMFSALQEILDKKGEPNQAQLFKPYGKDTAEAGEFAVNGIDTWKTDVLGFLQATLLKEKN